MVEISDYVYEMVTLFDNLFALTVYLDAILFLLALVFAIFTAIYLIHDFLGLL